jgi:hypothetical protein
MPACYGIMLVVERLSAAQIYFGVDARQSIPWRPHADIRLRLAPSGSIADKTEAPPEAAAPGHFKPRSFRQLVPVEQES